jgi:hypothetical protein
MADLEVWLVGTPDQLSAALAALAAAGQLTGASVPEPLYDRDAGRTRRYLRVALPAPASTAPAPVASRPLRRVA